MQSLLKSFLVTALVSVIAVSQSTAAVPVGTIVALQGFMTATGTDGAGRKLQIKSPVFLNDRLITGRASKAQVLFDDDTIISLGENSEMVVDKYIYSPRNKQEASCSMKFATGIFRVVTGKITSINPERFKVRTRMATIGIRGCEVGFAIDDDREDVYILWLPSGKSIHVERSVGGASDWTTALFDSRDSLNVFESGIAVSITEGARLMERAITPLEMADFYQQLAIGAAQSASGGNGTGGNTANTPGVREIAGAAGAISAEVVSKTLNDPSADSGAGQNQTPAGNGNEPPATPSSRPSLDSAPSGHDVPGTGPTGGGPTTPPGITTPTDPLPPTILAQGGGPADTWVYAVYSDGSVDHSHVPGYMLSDADFEILRLQEPYQLTGRGSSAAYITHSGGNRVVTGTCDFNVQMGTSPTWDGTFAMQNGTANSLSFDANGTIGTAAQLQLSAVNNYQLRVNGSSFNETSLTTRQLDLTSSTERRSALTGIGGANPVIDGVHGHFVFGHGASPMVNGVFGATLRGL